MLIYYDEADLPPMDFWDMTCNHLVNPVVYVEGEKRDIPEGKYLPLEVAASMHVPAAIRAGYLNPPDAVFAQNRNGSLCIVTGWLKP